MADIRHATGALRKQAEDLLRSHYMGSDGGSGYMFVTVEAGEVTGACLIGPSSSMGAERSIIRAPYRVWALKRLFAREGSLVPESQLIRHALREVAALRFAEAKSDRPFVCLSYADPLAVDLRDPSNPRELTGWLYLASGFHYIGLTSQPRHAVVDHNGAARSTRQGKLTLTRKTLPKAGDTFHGELITKDWQMFRAPSARIWLTVVAPRGMYHKHRAVRRTWMALTDTRKVAARQWVDAFALQALMETGREPLGDIKLKHVKGDRTFYGTYWNGYEMSWDARPVWVPYVSQGNLFTEEAVFGEVTAGRAYLPRLAAGQRVEA